jgi:hypothetical protein
MKAKKPTGKGCTIHRLARRENDMQEKEVKGCSPYKGPSYYGSYHQTQGGLDGREENKKRKYTWEKMDQIASQIREKK